MGKKSKFKNVHHFESNILKGLLGYIWQSTRLRPTKNKFVVAKKKNSPGKDFFECVSVLNQDLFLQSQLEHQWWDDT